jgi:outer membrane protein TolC
MRDAAQSRIEELRRTLTRDIGIAAAAQQTAHEQMKFHDEVLVPQAQLAFDSALAAYQTGRSSLDAVLSAESAYLRLQLDDTNYLAQHHKATHDLAALRSGARAGALGSAKTGGME